MSKYIEFGNMTMAEFAGSENGTVAKFMLVPGKKSLVEVSKSLKSACHKKGAACELKSRNILIESNDETWHSARILEAMLIK